MSSQGYLIRKLTDEEMKIIGGDDIQASIDKMHELIGCDMVEIPRLQPIQVICDESGWLKEDAYLNEIATVIHGTKLAGTILILPRNTVK